MLARQHGWSVSLVTTRPDRTDNPGFDVRNLPIVEDYAPSGLKKYIEAAKWYSIQHDPFAYRAFLKILERDPAEIVHFHNCQFLTLSLVAAANRAGKKTILSIYDYWLFCPTVMLVDPNKNFCDRAHGTWCVDCLPPTLRSLQRLLLTFRRNTIDRYLGLLDGFHVLSDHSAGVLQGYGIEKERIHAVPLSLPLEYRDAPARDRAPDRDMILFVGWLNERKGLHRLLQAMPRVLQEYPAARLTVIGGNVRFGENYRKKLLEIIENGRLQDRVTFLGHQPSSEVRQYLEKAAVVVIPEQYENMSPLVMIEAMCLGKPIVISRVGGVPEFMEDGVTGWLADPLRPEDFALGILKVLQQPDRASQLGENARKAILAKCAEDEIWQQTDAMYQRL